MIASCINGHKGVVTDLEHGRMVDPEDVGDITEAVGYFMRLNETEIVDLGSAARTQVLENYDRSVKMANYLRLFLELVPAEDAA